MFVRVLRDTLYSALGLSVEGTRSRCREGLVMLKKFPLADLEFGVKSLGSRVEGLGYMVQGLGFRV